MNHQILVSLNFKNCMHSLPKKKIKTKQIKQPFHKFMTITWFHPKLLKAVIQIMNISNLVVHLTLNLPHQAIEGVRTRI